MMPIADSNRATVSDDLVACARSATVGLDELVGHAARAVGLTERECRATWAGRVLEVELVDRSFVLRPGEAGVDLEIERAVAALTAAVSFRRARAMLAAAPAETASVPLWLVRGSTMLDAWLDWSRSRPRLARSLSLTRGLDGAPVAGGFRHRARRGGWRGSMRVDVRRGSASAVVSIDGEQPVEIAVGGPATVSLSRACLPATVVAALAGRMEEGVGVRLGDVVDHAFFRRADCRLRSVESDGAGVVVTVEDGWTALAPPPAEAEAVVPRDADPSAPWRATPTELSLLADVARDLHRAARRPPVAAPRY